MKISYHFSVLSKLSDLCSSTIILGGDLNLTLNSQVDKNWKISQPKKICIYTAEVNADCQSLVPFRLTLICKLHCCNLNSGRSIILHLKVQK